MSQYLNIHLRDKDGKFHYLTSYSRSSAFYQVAEAPYERVKMYTANDFEKMEQKLREWISNFDWAIKGKKDALEFLKTCNCSTDEIMDKFCEIQSDIAAIEGEKADCQAWIYKIYAFADIADDIESDCAIYMGIEISEPTEADIVS